MLFLLWISLSDISLAHPSKTLTCGSEAWNRVIRRPMEAHCQKLPKNDVCDALEAIRTCTINGERVRPGGLGTIEATRAQGGSWSLVVCSGGAEGDWCVKATIRGGRVTESTSETYRL